METFCKAHVLLVFWIRIWWITKKPSKAVCCRILAGVTEDADIGLWSMPKQYQFRKRFSGFMETRGLNTVIPIVTSSLSTPMTVSIALMILVPILSYSREYTAKRAVAQSRPFCFFCSQNNTYDYMKLYEIILIGWICSDDIRDQSALTKSAL